MPMLYAIRDWENLYEPHFSKSKKQADRVPIPNDMNGLKYAQLVQHERGEIHFAVWIAMLQIASLSNPRGELRRNDGTPFTIESMALRSRMRQSSFEEAIPRLVGELEWIDHIDTESSSYRPPALPMPGIGDERPGVDLVATEAALIRAWNETPGTLIVHTASLNKKRKADFQTRMKDKDWDWNAALAKFPLPMFSGGHGDWIPTLDWFLRVETVRKIIEGQYDRRINGKGSVRARGAEGAVYEGAKREPTSF